jgi:hypothetical protein
MGIVVIPLILVTSILLILFGEIFVRRCLALGLDWRLAALFSILITAPFAFAAFAALPLIFELDPLDGWMTWPEVMRFAATWSAYSSLFWGVMILVAARARSKGEAK